MFVPPDVHLAAAHAIRKHGPATFNMQRACNLMMEELGEVTAHANKLTSRNAREWECVTDHTRLQRLRDELVQLAAYALLQINNIDQMSEQILLCAQEARDAG